MSRTPPEEPAPSAPLDPVAELARTQPLLAIAHIPDPGVLETWPIAAVAALVGSVPQDHPISAWADGRAVPLWRIARSVAGPLRTPRDWAPDLLAEFAAVASALEVGWPTENTDLLGAAFQVRHRHATSEQLAWVDPAGLALEELLLLERHPRADARVLAGVLAELQARWHAGIQISDVVLSRSRRALERASTAVELGDPPAALAASVRLLLFGEDEEVRFALERTTHEVVFQRLLHIASLDARCRIDVLIRVATLGFGWQRGVALRRIRGREDVTADDFVRASHGVRAEDVEEWIAEPRLPAEALRVLSTRLPRHQHRVVQHPNAPRDLLEARSDVAFNAALESSRDEPWLAEVASRLRGTTDFFAVTRNPRCPPDLLAEVASHGVPNVRSIAAMHPRAGVAILRTLARDDDPEIRELVAMNRRAPAEVLAELGSDTSAVVRTWVAHHPSTPLAVLESLALDPHGRVRGAAGSRLASARLAEGLSTLEEVSASPRKVRRDAAARTHIDAAVEDQLAVDADVPVRRALAASLGVRRDTLEKLSKDPDGTVRHAVAEGAATPADIRARLAEDPRRWIAEAARASAHLDARPEVEGL